VSIDCSAPDSTVIKLDVEGNEAEALRGAEKTICANRPKMIISAYHRHKDLLLPLAVRSIRIDYAVSFSLDSCIPAWDSRFIFV